MWTKTIPTTPGWYWVQEGPHVRAFWLDPGGMWGSATDYLGSVDWFQDGALFWSEPLTPPESPV